LPIYRFKKRHIKRFKTSTKRNKSEGGRAEMRLIAGYIGQVKDMKFETEKKEAEPQKVSLKNFDIYIHQIDPEPIREERGES